MEGSNLRVLQGGRDPGFARAHRAEIERRLMARGLTADQAAQAFERGTAALEAGRTTATVPPGWTVALRVGDDPGDGYGAPIGWRELVRGCEGVAPGDMEQIAGLPIAGEVVLGGGAALPVSILRVT